MCWQPGFPVGQNDKVAISVHKPDITLDVAGHKAPTTSCVSSAFLNIKFLILDLSKHVRKYRGRYFAPLS